MLDPLKPPRGLKVELLSLKKEIQTLLNFISKTFNCRNMWNIWAHSLVVVTLCYHRYDRGSSPPGGI